VAGTTRCCGLRLLFAAGIARPAAKPTKPRPVVIAYNYYRKYRSPPSEWFGSGVAVPFHRRGQRKVGPYRCEEQVEQLASCGCCLLNASDAASFPQFHRAKPDN